MLQGGALARIPHRSKQKARGHHEALDDSCAGNGREQIGKGLRGFGVQLPERKGRGKKHDAMHGHNQKQAYGFKQGNVGIVHGFGLGGSVRNSTLNSAR